MLTGNCTLVLQCWLDVEPWYCNFDRKLYLSTVDQKNCTLVLQFCPETVPWYCWPEKLYLGTTMLTGNCTLVMQCWPESVPRYCNVDRKLYLGTAMLTGNSTISHSGHVELTQLYLPSSTCSPSPLITHFSSHTLKYHLTISIIKQTFLYIYRVNKYRVKFYEAMIHFKLRPLLEYFTETGRISCYFLY